MSLGFMEDGLNPSDIYDRILSAEKNSSSTNTIFNASSIDLSDLIGGQDDWY